MKKMGKHLLWIGILAALALPAFAETRTASWAPVTTYTDGTPIETGKTVKYSVYWTTDSGLGSLHTVSAGIATTTTTFDPGTQGMTRGGTVYFTVKTVLSSGEVSALSPGYAWVVPPATPSPAVLSGISVSGPSAVNAGGTGTYTATATWSDTTAASVTPTWSVSPATYATIGSGGVLTASAVTSNQSATVTATYGGKTGTKSVSIVIVPAGLNSVAVSGPPSVNEGGAGTYTATGTWDNGTTLVVTPTWSVSTSYATISAGGVLTASAVTSNQSVTVTATYGGKTGVKSVTIADVTGAGPATPKDIGINGPTSSGTTEIWQLHWAPVTTNWDGTPIDAGRTVRYTAYWTDDPALSEGSLRELASLISGTSLDFDPSGNQMAKNRVVYLTVRAFLDTGESSSLGASLTWRVENVGPFPPGRGKIYKK